ncbi:hypothetical protein HK101_007308 [Irineochytrium annulatum]|nr:hypothetical protein HK101_007308 [Irineochytrium annulatum]
MVRKSNNKPAGGNTVAAVQATVAHGVQAGATKQTVTTAKASQAEIKTQPKQQTPTQAVPQAVFLGPQNGGWFNQTPGAATINANAKVQQTTTPTTSTPKTPTSRAEPAKAPLQTVPKSAAPPVKAAAPHQQHATPQMAKVTPAPAQQPKPAPQQQAKVASQHTKVAPQQAKAASPVKQQAAASPAPVVKASPNKAVKKFVPQGMHLKATGRNALVVYCSLKTQVNHWARMNKVASRAASANKKGKLQQKAQPQHVKAQAKVQPAALKPAMIQKQASQTKIPVTPKPVARPVRATKPDDSSVTPAEINAFVANLFKEDAPKSKASKAQATSKPEVAPQPTAQALGKKAMPMKPEPVRQSSAAKIQQAAPASPATVTKASRQGSAKKVVTKKFVPQGMHLKATSRNALIVYRSLQTQVNHWALRENRGRPLPGSPTKKGKKRNHAPMKSNAPLARHDSDNNIRLQDAPTPAPREKVQPTPAPAAQRNNAAPAKQSTQAKPIATQKSKSAAKNRLPSTRPNFTATDSHPCLASDPFADFHGAPEPKPVETRVHFQPATIESPTGARSPACGDAFADFCSPTSATTSRPKAQPHASRAVAAATRAASTGAKIRPYLSASPSRDMMSGFSEGSQCVEAMMGKLAESAWVARIQRQEAAVGGIKKCGKRGNWFVKQDATVPSNAFLAASVGRTLE